MGRAILVLVVITLLLALMVTPAAAANGNGASFCSNAGAPTGSETPWIDGGNPGETASWLAQNAGFSGGFNPGHTPGPGGMPVTAGVCNPNTNPQS